MKVPVSSGKASHSAKTITMTPIISSGRMEPDVGFEPTLNLVLAEGIEPPIY